MGLFSKNKNGGLMDVIRCDEPSYLIWKWHIAGSQDSNNKRENAIRWGSSLRVKDGEVAVFVYKQNKVVQQDYILGPFDETIKTNNLPVLANIIGLAYDGGSPFQAEVYYINLAKIIQVKFGVPYFDVYDPRFTDFGVPIAVRGTISFKISDYREFIKLHRLSTFNLDDFQKQIRDLVIRYIKDIVTNAPSAHNIPIIQIETKISVINDTVELYVKERLSEDFGVEVSGIDIGVIEVDKESDGYRQLMAITRDVDAATIEAQKVAKVKNIHDIQRIQAENYEDSLRVQREEGQYSIHKDTQTRNFASFQVEAQTQVGVAGAEALGQMGANGAGSVNFGEGGIGFNPAAMMAGMAVGGAVGQNIASTMNGAMAQVNQMGITPPPVPIIAYNVVVNGQATGPFDLTTLQKMAVSGQFGENSLVWKQGMEEWTKANEVDELKNLFIIAMPPIPKVL